MLLEFPVELGVEEHDEVSEHAGELDSFCSLLRPLDPEISEIGPRWRRCPPPNHRKMFFFEKVEAATTNTSFGTGDGRTSRSW